MSSLIKREDAAEAIYEALRTPLPNYNNDFFHDSMSIAIAMANNIPSAGPDRKFLEIVAEYPEICTYPEFKGKPYYSIMYEENGETIVGFGTYKPEVLSQYLREYFLPSAESERKFIPFEIALPNDRQKVLCVNKRGEMMVGGYLTDYGMSFPCYFEKPVAWMPLPEPYRGEE